MHTLQQLLADAIHPRHQRIEENPFMHALHHKEPLEEPYRWLLSKLYPFSQGGEQKLISLIGEEEGFNLPQRLREHLLKEDLVQLNILPVRPDTDSFDSINTLGKAIGLLYVMEGSRKGGTFLSALISQSGVSLPMRYLTGYGYTTDQEWNHFCDLLERYANTSLQEEIVEGAIHTFEILERIFNDHS